MTSVTVNSKAENRLAAGHPWIYASDVTDRSSAQPGDAVHVLNRGGRFLGVAHYSSSSQITLRLLTRKDIPIGRPFFLGRLRDAIDFRRRIAPGASTLRLVHAEADFLPALIVDRYEGYLSIQLLNQGMDREAPTIIECLVELLSPDGIAARNDVPVRRLENLPLEPVVLRGEVPGRLTVRINSLSMAADLLHGQKTGVFLDQRENYLAAARYGRGRGLDCFTSTGGFALHLASSCDSVEAVDSAPAVLELARLNAQANSLANITWREANAFDYLSGLVSTRRQFDIIVLDPPAFAKSKSNLESALRGYREINFKALKLLAPGGILVTCSCSHHVAESDLFQTVAQAALDARRTLRVLERRTQSADHPILLTVPETHYLKCLILEAL